MYIVTWQTLYYRITLILVYQNMYLITTDLRNATSTEQKLFLKALLLNFKYFVTIRMYKHES